MKIKVDDTKNANKVRKTNTDLKAIDEEIKKAEELKPKACNCDCGEEGQNAPVTGQR